MEPSVTQRSKSKLYIRSERSFIATYLFSCGLIFLGIAALIGFVQDMTSLFGLFAIAFGIGMLYTAMKTLTLQIEITEDRLKVKQLWRTYHISWDSLRKVTIVPSYADNEHLTLHYNLE